MFKNLLSLLVITITTVIVCITSLIEVATAQSRVSYVSGKGIDSGNCDNPSSPCRTFQYAVDHTNTFGEVKALDPDNYGRVTISKTISLTGVDGAGIYWNSIRGSAITIDTSGLVSLTGLTLNGTGAHEGQQNSGIIFNGSGELTITHCTITNFLDAGIDIRESSEGFLIAHTVVSNTKTGITIAAPQAAWFAGGVLDHVQVHSNRVDGIVVGGASGGGVTYLTAVGITASDNGRNGIVVQGNSAVTLAHSTITGNATYGISIVGTQAGAVSFGDNYIRGNGQDINGGTLFHVSAQ